MDDCNFSIKNPEFLPLLVQVNKTESLDKYRFIERLIYGNKVDDYKALLETKGMKRFLEELEVPETPRTASVKKSKRKTIKEDMIESYAIRNNIDVRQVNTHLFLHGVNAMVVDDNGEILTIKKHGRHQQDHQRR